MQSQIDLYRTIEEYDQEILVQLQKIQKFNNNVDDLLNLVEDLELNVGIEQQQFRIDHAQIQFICLLCQWDITEARTMFQRIRKEYREEGNFQVLHQILVRIWEGKNQEILLVIDQAISSFSKLPNILILLEHLKDKANKYLIKDIAKNYKTISIQDFMSILNIKNIQDAQRQCANLNWNIDEQQFIETNLDSLLNKDDVTRIRNQQMNNITQLSSILDSLQ